MIDPLRRGLPSDAATEALVLGALISDPDAWHEASGGLTADCFAIEDHRRIYAAMAALAERDEAIDRVTVANELGAELAKMGGVSRLIALDEGLPRVHNIASYADILSKLARKRDALWRVVRLYEHIEASTEETIVQAVEGLTEAICAPAERRDWLDPEGVIDQAGGIERLLSGVSTHDAIRPPWPKLAELTEAWLPGELVIVGARPGVGKTIWLTNVMESASSSLRPIRMASLEMLAQDVLLRMACARSSVSLGRVTYGHATIEEKRALNKAIGELQAMQIKFRDSTQFSVSQLAAAVRRAPDCRAVFVDYIGLMDGPGRNPQERVSTISRQLKQLALRHRLTVFAACQLNRSAPSENREPRLEDLRESGSLEQDADRVYLLHELTEQMSDGSRRVDCIVAKQRRGPTGRVQMWRVGRFSRMEEV